MTEVSSEQEAIQLDIILANMNNVLDSSNEYYIGTPLYDKTLENGNKWNIIIRNEDQKIYGTDWNFIVKDTEISNYGKTQYNWLVNYITGEMEQIEDGAYTQLMYGKNLVVKDGLILNVDPINMSDSTSWGDGVKLYGVQEGDGYGWNGTEIKFDGVDDYIELYNSFEEEEGITFEFYAKNENNSQKEIPVLSKSLPQREYAGIRSVIANNQFQLSMNMVESDSDWVPNANLRHWIFKDTNQDFQSAEGGYITIVANMKESSISLYSAGELIGKTTVSPNWIKTSILQDSNVPFLIGKRYGYEAGDKVVEQYGKLNIYACRLYNKVLTDNEVKENYDKTRAYHNMLVNQ